VTSAGVHSETNGRYSKAPLSSNTRWVWGEPFVRRMRPPLSPRACLIKTCRAVESMKLTEERSTTMLAAPVSRARTRASSSMGEVAMSSSPCTTSTSEPSRPTVSILRGMSKVGVPERINLGSAGSLVAAYGTAERAYARRDGAAAERVLMQT